MKDQWANVLIKRYLLEIVKRIGKYKSMRYKYQELKKKDRLIAGDSKSTALNRLFAEAGCDTIARSWRGRSLMYSASRRCRTGGHL